MARMIVTLIVWLFFYIEWKGMFIILNKLRTETIFQTKPAAKNHNVHCDINGLVYQKC